MAKYSALSTGGGESHNEFESPNAKKNMQLVAKAREGCVESIHLECNRECNRQWILSAYSIHIFTTGLKNMWANRKCDKMCGSSVGDDLDHSSHCDYTADIRSRDNLILLSEPFIIITSLGILWLCGGVKIQTKKDLTMSQLLRGCVTLQ